MPRYGCTITVQTGEMPSTQTNFAWVAVTANFPTAAIDGGSQSILNGGGNLRCYTDDTKATRLPIEVVEFATGGSPSVVIWGLSASLGVGGTVYIEGDIVATTQPAVGNLYGRDEVWVDYNRVYHLNEAVSTATGNYVDSSGNGDGTLNSTTNVTSVTGQIGDATQSLNSAGGSSPLIDTGLVPNTTNIRTLEFWVNYSTTSNSQGYAQGSDDANNRRFYLGLDGDVRVFAGVGTGFMGFGTNPNPSGIVAGSWYKQSLSVDGSTATVYVNGVAKGSFAYTFSGTSTSNFTILGRNRATVETRIQGIADLYTIGKNEKSADLLLSEFNNQDNPSTFWSASAWEDQDSGLTIIPTSIASAESFGTPTITTGVVLISPVAIPTQESVGNPTILKELFISPVTIPSEESVGDPVIELILQQIFPNGIPTEEFVGRPIVLGGDSIVIPVLSRQTWNAVAKYLRDLVFKGHDNDVIVAWLRSEGFEDGAYNDLWYDYLLQKGFIDGSLTDKYAAWRQDIAGDDPWILSSGSWNDNKIWRDNENWKDS
jgi:hypothetical protein